jgi:hypothetical protein
MIYKRIQSSTEQFWDQSKYLTLYCHLSIVYRNYPQTFQAGNTENNWATHADQLDLVPVLAYPRHESDGDLLSLPAQNICIVSPLYSVSARSRASHHRIRRNQGGQEKASTTRVRQ